MADSKHLVTFSSGSSTEVSPTFTSELVRIAERTALSFHLSYLYLAGYPELEKLIRSRALNARLLFVSSERVMFKCVCTSDNLVKTLYPILRIAIQKNKSQIAKTYLAKAQDWIKDIIQASKNIVEEYKAETTALSKTTSDIYAKREETHTMTKEMQTLNERLGSLRKRLDENNEKKRIEQKGINDAKADITKYIDEMTKNNKALAATLSVSPFLDSVFKTIAMSNLVEQDLIIFKSLNDSLQVHMSEMDKLNSVEQKLQDEMMDVEMKLMSLALQQGSVPSTEHLEGVQTCMSKIQDVLIQVLRYWEHVGEMLNKLEQQSLGEKELLDDLVDFKDQFLIAVTSAEEAWVGFGKSCMKAQQTFAIQAKDSYKFLELAPSSISAEERQEQCDAVNKRLKGVQNEFSAVAESPASE